MDRNFQRALRAVLKSEGGYVNHSADPGGHTNKGVTLATYRRYIDPNGTVADLKAITDETAGRVYRRQYWNMVKGDSLPDGLDFAVFDFAVNSGPSRAAKYLQRIVGSTQDGVIGPKTLAAVDRFDVEKLINQLCDDRLAFLKRLSHWDTFGRGWSRRVSEVRSLAVHMHRNAPKNDSTAPQNGSDDPTPTKKRSGGTAAIVVAVLAALGAVLGKLFGII